MCISSGIKPPEIKMNCEGAVMINLLGLQNNFSVSIETRVQMLTAIKVLICIGTINHAKYLGKMAHITFLLEGQTHSERYEEAKKILTR